MMRLFFYPFIKGYVFLFHGRVFNLLINNIPFFRPIKETRENETPIPFNQWLRFAVLGGKAGGGYFPIHSTSVQTGDWRNIIVGIDSSPTVSPGCYVQSVGRISIGDYTQVAPNVGIISSNHFMFDIRKHIIGSVEIGSYCRIGMGSIIHSNVKLGDFVTVAAGSIVKHSFEEGYCVIGGNPAVIIHDYSKNEKIKSKFLRYKNEFEYNGFVKASEFASYRASNLNF
jgi:acetyltransferase-like isoleucine patch superfamily enzyme